MNLPKPIVTAARSPRWDKVREAHLVLFPICAACGSRLKLNVHHIKPFHLFPELELEPSNLITLCEGDVVNCHLLFGHLRSWHSFNEDVRADAAVMLVKIRRRPSRAA